MISGMLSCKAAPSDLFFEFQCAVQIFADDCIRIIKITGIQLYSGCCKGICAVLPDIPDKSDINTVVFQMRDKPCMLIAAVVNDCC